jgi:hypothetical protein
MAEDKKEPKLTIPSDLRPFFNNLGEPVVELLTVPGKPVIPINDPIVDALIVQHLNKTGDTAKRRVDVVRALLLAKASQSGVEALKDGDLFMETTLVIAIVLYCRRFAKGFDTNTLDIQRKLLRFAQTKIDTTDWPKGPAAFSRAITNSAVVLKRFDVIAIKLSDGYRSWNIRILKKGDSGTDATDATDATTQKKEKPDEQ